MMGSDEDALVPARQDRRDGEALLRAFVAGDPGALRLVERWAREIVRYRWSSLRAEDGDDIVQDTVAGAWRAAAAPGFALRTSLRALVRRIAIARCIDCRRRRRMRVALDESLVDERAAHEAAFERLDEGARLRQAVFSLEPRCRELLRAHFLEERPYAEIAAHWQRAQATMRVHVFQCLKALRALWRREVE